MGSSAICVMERSKSCRFNMKRGLIMGFERILQMTTSKRNLALLQEEAFVDDVTEFLAIRQLYNAAIKQVRTKLEILNDRFQVEHCHNPIHHIE